MDLNAQMEMLRRLCLLYVTEALTHEATCKGDHDCCHADGEKMRNVLVAIAQAGHNAVEAAIAHTAAESN